MCISITLINVLTEMGGYCSTVYRWQYIPKKIFNRIRYVTAHFIKYQHQLLIPGLSLTLNSPSFSATLPRESLGVTR